MKKIALVFRALLVFIGIFSAFCLSAQNTKGASDDLGRIALNPIILNESGIPAHAHSMLDSKLTQIVTKCGLAADSPVPRFVITADALLIAKEVTATAPVMTVVEIAVTVYVGDAETGQLFGTYAYAPAKGVGTNETKAYLEALKKINVNDSGVIKFVEASKAKIIEYYNSQIDFIIAEAQALHDSQKYEEAMVLLSTIPDVCKDAYTKAMSMIATVFQSKIDRDGLALYNEAYARWTTSKEADFALSAVELLAKINPLSSAAAMGRELVKEIEAHYAELEARRREIEERNWAFEQQQYSDDQEASAEQRQFDYDIYMTKSMNSAEAAQMALNEVKNVVSSFTAAPAGGDALLSKVSSWFN